MRNSAKKSRCLFRRAGGLVLLLLAACLATPATADDYSDVVNSHGPDQYWRLGETSGSTAYNAASSRDGSYVNWPSKGQASPIDGITDTAVSFNGSDEYVVVSDHYTLDFTSSLTIMAWVKGDSWGSGSDVDVIVRKGEGNPNNYQFCVADGKVSLMLDEGDGDGFRGNTTLSTGEWYFVAATWNGSQVRIYVNGVQDHASAYAKSGNIGTDNRALYLGGRSGADYFDGTLDEIAIFDYALSAADILEIYEAAFPEPQTWYVRPDGSNSNDGDGPSAGDAWRTVEAAVEKSEVRAGDTIYVMTGTYVASVDPSIDGNSGNPITLIADTSGAVFGASGPVVLEASSDNEALDFDNVDYLTFRGFTIDGDNVNNQAVELDNCEGIVLERCIITDSNYEGIDANNSSLTLVNCLLYGNNSYGVEINDSDSEVTILHCTIVDNDSDGVKLVSGTVTVTNCIIAYNGDDGLDYDSGTMNHSYNLLYGNNDDNYNGTSSHWSEIQSNPQFVDASSDNYQLQASSPAIDAGANASGLADNDLLGVSRPVGSGYDVGCYEFPLLGQWFFEETSGTTAYDSSGSGNHGTLSGGLSFSSDSVSACAASGNALDFNGSSDYIAVSNSSSLQITQSLTIVAWIRGDSWGSGSSVNAIVRKGEGNPNNYQFCVADGHLALMLDDSDGGGYRGDTELQTATWYHVAATWDGQNVRLYVNGVQDHDSPFAHAAPIGTDTRQLHLGGRSGTDCFDGQIDNIQLYGYAFSAEEITAEYGLVGYWPLDETSGNTAYDSGPYGLDATLMSNPAWQSEGGMHEGGLKFDGYNDYLEVPSSNVHEIDVFTISGWFKLDNSFTSSTGTTQFICEKFYSGDFDMLVALAGTDYTQGSVPGGSMVFKVETNAGACYHWTDRTSWQAGVWYHFAIVHDGSTGEAYIYIDGVDDTSSSAVGSSSGIDLDYNAPLHFGGRYADSQVSGDRYLDGTLDDLRLFNRPLCAEEVAAAHASGSATPGGSRIIRWVEIP